MTEQLFEFKPAKNTPASIVQRIEQEGDDLHWEYFYNFDDTLYDKMPVEKLETTIALAKEYPMKSMVMEYLGFTAKDIAGIYLKSKFFLTSSVKTESEVPEFFTEHEYNTLWGMILNLAAWLKVNENILDKDELLKRCEVVNAFTPRLAEQHGISLLKIRPSDNP